jgi:hypothetical protein
MKLSDILILLAVLAPAVWLLIRQRKKKGGGCGCGCSGCPYPCENKRPEAHNGK